MSDTLASELAEQNMRLRALVGDNHADHLIVAIGQACLDDAQRVEVGRAMLDAATRSAQWWMAPIAVEPMRCGACGGDGMSRSSRGKCRTCNGFGRSQVKCRRCDGQPWTVRQSCRDCHGKGELDPLTKTSVIVDQWLEGVRGLVKQIADEKERPVETNQQETAMGTWVASGLTMDPAKMNAKLIDPNGALLDHEAQCGPMPVGIALRLLAAQCEVNAVRKDSENENDGYIYASAESIIGEANRALHAQGLMVLPVTWRIIDGRIEVYWCVLAPQAGLAWQPPPVSMPVVHEGRGVDKSEGAALTYLQSQWLRQLLQIKRTTDREVDQRADRKRKQMAPAAAEDGAVPAKVANFLASFRMAVAGATNEGALEGARRRLDELSPMLTPSAIATANEQIARRRAELGMERLNAARPGAMSATDQVAPTGAGALELEQKGSGT